MFLLSDGKQLFSGRKFDLGKWPRINTVSLGENSFGQKQDETVFMEYLILKPVPKQVSERRFAQCQPVGIEGCCPEMMLIQPYKK